MHRAIWAGILAATGAVLALFMVFQPLFTDGPANLHPERLASYALTLAAFTLASWAGSRYGPWQAWTAAWLGLPGAVVLSTYHDGPLTVNILVGGAMLAGLTLGTWMGLRQQGR